MKAINILKKVFISVIVLTMVMAFAFSFNKTSVNAALEPDSFIIKGISIRTSGKQGIRFKLSVFDPSNTFKTAGLLIAFGDTSTVFNENSTVNGKTVLNGYTSDIDENGIYYITLYNIPLDQCMQNVTILQYAITDNDRTYYDIPRSNINLSTIAYKAMNDGITSSLLTDVDTYMNANYKKVYVDEFDNLVFDGFKETNPNTLKEVFIKDINQYASTTLTTDSSITDWVTQLQYNTNITDSKLYQAYNTTKFNNKWSWLLTYLGTKNNTNVSTQINVINGQTGSDLNNFKNLIYSLYNFFHCLGLNIDDSIPFNTESAYADLTTSNIYPEIEDYDDIRKIGTSSALGHEDDVLGYTLYNWEFNDNFYLTTDTYTVTSDNVKFLSNKACHVTYTISNNQVSITGLAEDVNVTDLVILSSYEGYPVTSIGDSAFKNCTTLTSVTIQKSVTSIVDYAFCSCISLTSITIPTSVTNIGAAAFSGCTSLTSITIPNSVTNIGQCIFSSCTSLTSITIDSNNPIYDSRNNCNAIIETASNTLVVGCKNTTIPNTVRSIGNSAFYSCEALTTITIPSSVTSIGIYAFYSCEDLTSVTIPNSVTSIGDNVFENCKSLTSIFIPASVETIGSRVFLRCTYTLKIYCEVAKKPSGWNSTWNFKSMYEDFSVTWGYTN